jgi:hypothetical protein
MSFQELKTTLLEKVNEHYFGVAVLLASSALTWYSIAKGLQGLQVVSLILLRVGIYLTIGSLFVTFLNGLGFNVKDEIFVEHNQAAATLVAGFWIGLAVAVSCSF